MASDMRNSYKRTSIGFWTKVIGGLSLLIMVVVLPVRSQDMPRSSEFFTIASTLFPGVNMQQDNQVPPTLKQKISVNFQNISLKEALNDIAKKAEFKLSYSDEHVPLDKRITLNAEDVSVNKVLWRILKGTGLRFALSPNKHLVLIRWEERDQQVAEETIRGTVNDSRSGKTLPGVNIMVKGTTNGTSTGPEGGFKLTVSSLQDTLVFSFIGYKTEEVPISGRTEIDVEMEPQTVSGDEVVVVGYGTQKRSNLTGAISSVDIGSIESKSVNRLDQALQGLSAGVQVAGGFAPGSSPTIHIRGVGSIGNSDPLWIVDGVKLEGGPGNFFDVDDVESMEVLKGATAASIYGAEAAHGVILVTTKRGNSDLQVSFQSSISKKAPIQLPNLLNSEQFVQYKKQSRLNAGQNPEPAWDDYEHNTDWIDAYYDGRGMLQSNDLSISRGGEKYNFYLSLGYDNESGILIDNNYKRYGVRFNSDLDLTDWLKVGESALFSKVVENPIDNFNESFSGGIPYRSIPLMPIRDEDNSYGGWGQAPAYFQGPNPVATQHQQHEEQKYSRLNGNIYLQADPLKGLTLKSTFGYNYMSNMGEVFQEAFDYGAFANTINSLTYSHANSQTITANIVATYQRSLGDHFFKIMGGYEASKTDSKHFNVTGTDLPVDVGWSMNLATGTFGTTDRQNVYNSRLLSQFGRLNYNYDEKYFVEANIRRDASAPKFGPENLWGVFPSFSAAWRISDESFMNDISFVSDLKLRISTGKLGSDNIGNFIYDKTYTSQFSSYAFDPQGQDKVSGFYLSKFPNEAVRWEEVVQHNVGLDAGFLSGKYNLSVDYYIKDTNDLLYGVPIPASVGIAVHNQYPVNPQINIGSMRNTGVDIGAGARFSFNDFQLNLKGNASYMKNEMQALNEDEFIIGGNGGGQIGGMTRTQVGMPISSFYGFIVQRVLDTEEEVYAINSWAPDGIYQEAGTAPGDFMYKDISGPNGEPDGQITAHDRTFIGNPWPKWQYGLNINVNYKQLIDLSVLIQGVWDVDVFNAEKAYTRNFFGDNNTTTKIREAWTPENHTDHPRNIASDPNGNFSNPSTYFVEDGSYLKLRNVQLGFNVPRSFLNKVGLSKTRIYVNASNILTITGYSGMDPEVAGSNTGRGVDYGQYPQTYTLGAGIEIEF